MHPVPSPPECFATPSLKIIYECVRTLGGPAGAASISAHGNSFLVLLHILEEGDSASQLPAIDGLGSFPRVLERHAEVRAAGAGRLGGMDLGRSVSDLEGNQVSVWPGRRDREDCPFRYCFWLSTPTATEPATVPEQ